MSPKSVIEYYGNSLSRTARALGCKPQTVSEWVDNGEIPEGRQYQIELATGGKLRADKPALRAVAQEAA